MRVLEKDDLRWVSGGFCTFNKAEYGDCEDAADAYRDAGIWVLYYQNLLGQQTYQSPEWYAVKADLESAQGAESAAQVTLLEYMSQNASHYNDVALCSGDHAEFNYT